MSDKVVTSNKPEAEEKKDRIPAGLRADGQWHATVEALRAQDKPLFFIQRRGSTMEVETSIERARVWVHKQHDPALRIYRRDWTGGMMEVA